MSAVAQPDPGSLLKMQRCTMRFGGLTAVSELDLQITGEELIGLIGPNGAGKTTAFNLVTGVYPPTEGEILFGGQPISRLPPHQITARGIARTFQIVRMLPSLTVLENIAAGGVFGQDRKSVV